MRTPASSEEREKKKLFRTRRRVWFASFFLLLAVVGLGFLWQNNPQRGFPYHDSFAKGRAEEWRAIGGSWSVSNGTMRNDSDERGSKLLSGSKYWRDYRFEADVRMRNPFGDIGIILRSNEEERGVDAYNGYYVGLRNGDNSLVVGRADHGWMEALPLAFPGGVAQNRWYRLRAAAVGCRIAASATNLETGATSQLLFEDQPCVQRGRIGLRSLSTGGEWRNITVTHATEADLQELSKNAKEVQHPNVPKSEAIYNQVHTYPSYDPPLSASGQTVNAETAKPLIQPIGTLGKNYDEVANKRIVIRGVVVLTYPALYVQDATGGAAIKTSEAPNLSLGDEVEVSGTPELSGYSVSLRDSSIRLLWNRVPMPPMAVTSEQAATGAYDSVLVETEGYLVSKAAGPNNTLVLQMESGTQSFQVIAFQGRGSQLSRDLTTHSLLRLRGICVTDKKYTNQQTPFALLLRSSDDVDILAGPPWWTTWRLMEIAFVTLLLILGVQLLLARAEQWRLRGIVQERERLAHDMHDTLAQSFAGVAFQLQGIRNGLRHNHGIELSKVDQQLEVACDIVRRTHEEASLTIAMLRPDSREVADLLYALDRCANQIVAGGEITIRSNCEGNTRPLPLRMTEALFHIGREAIVNSVRHANPSQISIGVTYHAHSVELSVVDDGIGFDTSIESRRLGLRGMNKRAKAIAAELKIESMPDKGTAVYVSAPLEKRAPMIAYLRDKFRQLVHA